MVLLTITPATLRALEVYTTHSGGNSLKKDGDPDLSKAAEGDPISHGQLVDLSNIMKREHLKLQKSVNVDFGLETFLRGAKVYVPPPKPKPAKVGQCQASPV